MEIDCKTDALYIDLMLKKLDFFTGENKAKWIIQLGNFAWLVKVNGTDKNLLFFPSSQINSSVVKLHSTANIESEIDPVLNYAFDRIDKNKNTIAKILLDIKSKVEKTHKEIDIGITENEKRMMKAFILSELK